MRFRLYGRITLSAPFIRDALYCPDPEIREKKILETKMIEEPTKEKAIALAEQVAKKWLNEHDNYDLIKVKLDARLVDQGSGESIWKWSGCRKIQSFKSAVKELLGDDGLGW